jgi:hypothetical protein
MIDPYIVFGAVGFFFFLCVLALMLRSDRKLELKEQNRRRDFYRQIYEPIATPRQPTPEGM